MLSPIKIQQIRNLYNQNKSIKSIVRTLKLSRNTVRKYISLDETTTHKTRKVSEAKLFLETNKMHIHALFIMHKYYCVPLKRTIFEKYGIDIHLRMLQKFCKPFRLNKFPKKSPIRFETPRGQQMQIDFTTAKICIDNKNVNVHIFVSILSYSRKIYAKAYIHEKQETWFDGIESSFYFFGGVPLEIISDNTKHLVRDAFSRNDAEKFTTNYQDFCNYWAINPISCQFAYPQSKGKIERAIQYLKSNALPGKKFTSLNEFNNYLVHWSTTVSDLRQLDASLGELRTPCERYLLEKDYLQSADKPRFIPVRKEVRKVSSDGLIRVDNKSYRVPRQYIKQTLDITISNDGILASHNKNVVAKFAL